MKYIGFFLITIRSVLAADLATADYSDMCDECATRNLCSSMFNLPHGTTCSIKNSELFNSSIIVLKEQCDVTIKTNFVGTTDSEVLGIIAEALMNDCGPNCGKNEYPKVNADENALYCACSGKCIDDFKDNTLNALVGTLIGLLVIKSTANILIMLDSRYNLGYFEQINSNAPIVGKTV